MHCQPISVLFKNQVLTLHTETPCTAKQLKDRIAEMTGEPAYMQQLFVLRGDYTYNDRHYDLDETMCEPLVDSALLTTSSEAVSTQCHDFYVHLEKPPTTPTKQKTRPCREAAAARWIQNRRHNRHNRRHEIHPSWQNEMVALTFDV